MISTVSSEPGTKRAGQRGQISIFFASSLIILISVIAFVINIGLFVKAKINLQNATDAAAYAGAAVQARMLNKVGYLNWDMRNVFKEWMFKYYVLGNLNIDQVMNPASAGNTISFRMQPDPNIPDAARAADIYNFPSVCLHFAGIKTNVCKKYGIPGIPRFEPTNLVGIDETTSSFIDGIVSAKTEDCSKRSRLNFNVTNMWAYQVMDSTAGSTFADAPQVVQNRPGAWPKAVELAIRVRSVERAINRPPIVGGVCAPDSNPAGPCAQRTTQLENEPHYGNERPLKAFWSGFRNLGNESDNEMKKSFTLTELAPTAVTFPKVNDLSTMLIRSELRNEPKHYVDLKLQMVNYATFFTALISRTGTVQAGSTTVTAQGACDVAKIAVPVPGYPLGYFKNPEVLTYYAVKGEANFQGLFNPFAAKGVVKMTAWAAAKPMGGRIGPALFQAKPSDSSVVVSRTTSTKRRSTSYMSGLNLTNVPRKTGPGNVPLGEYSAGMPVPINNGSDLTQRFWVGNVDDVLGGWASNSAEIVFGIPNLAYDFVGNDFTNAKHDLNAEKTIIINPTAAEGTYAAGLYRADQFRPFRANLTEVSVDGVEQAVDRVRSPTRYEAANYLIPTPGALHLTEKIGEGFSDNFGGLTGPVLPNRPNVRQFTFYAPLYSTNLDAAYRNQADVVKAFRDFMLAQQPAMEKYLRTMNQVAYKIYSDKPDLYAEAARRISDFDFTKPPTTSGTPSAPRTCQSIAGQFMYYYFGPGDLSPADAGCPKPLIKSLEEFVANISGPNSPISDTFHRMEYSFPGNSITKYPQMLTGYMPGPLRGVSNIGVLNLPFSGEKETVRRSGYSTKFVTLKSLTASGGYAPGSGTLATYSEDRIAPLNEDIVPKVFRNALSGTALPATVTH